MKQKNITPPHIIAAQITFLVSTIWVLNYLIRYQWGTAVFSTQILEIIISSMGQADAALGSTALFLILSRYLLSFGILWPILSWIIGIFSRKNKRIDTEKDNSIQAN